MKKNASLPTLFATLLVAVMHFSLTACQAQQQAPTGTAAPKGEQRVLEQLADAFREVADGLPTNPASLPPEGRKELVQLVFSKTGYDYRTTLTTLASDGLDPSNRLHRDLVELVLFPTAGVAPDDIRRLFDGPEAAAIEHIKKVMN